MDKRLIGFGIVALLGGGAVLALGAGGSERVDAYTPVTRPLTQTLLVTGRLVPPRQLELGAMIQGTVAHVAMEEGEVVEAGQLLVQLADDEARARLQEAEARVQEAQARLVRVRGVGRKLADERLEQARIEGEEADRAFARAETLHAAGSLTEADFDAARARRDGARSRRVAAELEAAASSRGGSDVQAAAAALAQAQAALEVARTALARTQLRAPTAGRVLVRDVELGQVVRPGDVAVVLAGEGPLEVRIHPDEYHLGTLAVGQRAMVSTEAFPERPLAAEVAHIAPRVDPTKGTVEVRLALADELGDLALKPEMSATVEVVLGARDQALVLPRRLIHELGSGRPWVVVEEDGTARRADVELGLQGTEAVELVGGLSPEAHVLERSVDPGDAVRVKRVQPALPVDG